MKSESAFWRRSLEWGKEQLAPPHRSFDEAYRHELKYLISYTASVFTITATGVLSWNAKKSVAAISTRKLRL